MNKNKRITKIVNGKAVVDPNLYPRPECGVFPCGRVGVCKFSLPRYRKRCPINIVINRLADLEDMIERGELLEVVPDETD